MSDLQTAQQHWHDTLDQLQLTMTRATFEAWVKETRVVAADNGAYTIAAASDFAVDWLQNRLYKQLQRALAQISGSDVNLVFVAAETTGPGPAGQAAPTTTPVARSPSRAEQRAELLRTAARAAILDFNVFEHGYIGHPHYIQRFWGAYLGAAALAVYLYIRSFYKEPRYLKDGPPNPKWTPWTNVREERDGGPYRPVELALAIHSKQVRNPNTGKICGRWRVCPDFDEAYQQGDIWDTCRCHFGSVRRGQMADAHPSDAYPNGRRICHFWDPGLMERETAEGILLYERTGDPRKPKTVFYLAQVYQPLPLLAPRQVASLNEKTQREHEAYLSAHGINLDDWSAEFKDEPSLVPLAISWAGATLTPPV